MIKLVSLSGAETFFGLFSWQSQNTGQLNGLAHFAQGYWLKDFLDDFFLEDIFVCFCFIKSIMSKLLVKYDLLVDVVV